MSIQDDTHDKLTQSPWRIQGKRAVPKRRSPVTSSLQKGAPEIPILVQTRRKELPAEFEDSRTQRHTTQK